jgi:hypothetical protein
MGEWTHIFFTSALVAILSSAALLPGEEPPVPIP